MGFISSPKTHSTGDATEASGGETLSPGQVVLNQSWRAAGAFAAPSARPLPCPNPLPLIFRVQLGYLLGSLPSSCFPPQLLKVF